MVSKTHCVPREDRAGGTVNRRRCHHAYWSPGCPINHQLHLLAFSSIKAWKIRNQDSQVSIRHLFIEPMLKRSSISRFLARRFSDISAMEDFDSDSDDLTNDSTNYRVSGLVVHPDGEPLEYCARGQDD